MARMSSLSEKSISYRPRRLADWLNPTGARKVHSLVDKVYKRKNLAAMLWLERVARKQTIRRVGTCEPGLTDTFTCTTWITHLCESPVWENCTLGLGGGRRLAL